MTTITRSQKTWARNFGFNSPNDRVRFHRFLKVKDLTAGGRLVKDKSGLSKGTAGGWLRT